MALIAERIETLVIARAAMATEGFALAELVKPMVRFAPVDLTAAAWRARLEEAASELRARGVLDVEHRVADREELTRRIGRSFARTWAALADRVLPGLGLAIAADDAKAHGRMIGRDGWAAAIAGRALGLWLDGPPPSLAGVCDGLAWRELGLAGTPKRCPPEVRAVFVQRELGSEAGPPERLIRVLAAREVGAPRPELRALREALVRGWLAGRTLGPAPSQDDQAHETTMRGAGATDDSRRAGPTDESARARIVDEPARAGALHDSRYAKSTDAPVHAGPADKVPATATNASPHARPTDEPARAGAGAEANRTGAGAEAARAGAGAEAARAEAGAEAARARAGADAAQVRPTDEVTRARAVEETKREGEEEAGRVEVAGEALRGFAAEVRRVAGAVGEGDGRFGERKVFVSAVWNEGRARGRWAEMGGEQFKAWLFAAHAAGELTLARADLVAAMDPGRVAASEIVVNGATFHFVVQERAS